MKKPRVLHRILSLLLVLVLMLPTLPVLPATAFAASGTNGGEVYATALSGRLQYYSIDEAWAASKKGYQITLQRDWYLSDRLILEDKGFVRINMNGYRICRGNGSDSALTSRKSNGEVFWMGKNATLELYGYGDQGETVKETFSFDGWSGGSRSRQTIESGGLITGGWSTNGAGGIHMREGACVVLSNVALAGNRAERTWNADGYGGGVMMDGEGGLLRLKNGAKISYNMASYGAGVYIDKKSCTVTMEGESEISYNYAQNGGGGIYSYDLKNAIEMNENSKIVYNSAKEGGGVYFDYTQFALKSPDATASISNNTARDNHGGAIYIEHSRSWLFMGDTNSGRIHGITFDGNHADNGYGGAIYIQQESITVSSCRIKNNTAKYGGGIYNNNDSNTISGTTITNNKAHNSGGGVFSSAMNDIALSGKVIIKDNTRDDETNDNLYLNDTSTTTAYLVGSPSAQSEIGIRTEKPTSRKLGKNQEFYYEDAFFYDLGDDYHIEFKEDKAELWLEKGRKAIVSADTVTPKAEATATTVNGQVLTKGYFSYPSMMESEEDLDSVFYYSDGYFLSGRDGAYGDPTRYNEHLATMSMAMAMAGFYSHIGNDGSLDNDESLGNRTYTYKSQNIKRLLTDIGVAADKVYISDSNAVKPGTNTIGVAIGSKEIGNNTILIPISVRGSGYESEWSGNTTVGTEGEHEGFAVAADQVLTQVKNYIRNYNLTDAVNEGRVKFWIAGYSRAGATSNLTAKRLIETYCNDTGNQVYAYCFEAPKGGLLSEMKLPESAYYSIHNCINEADAVPLVAPEEMGFIRYGVDHYVPGTPTAGEIKSDSKGQVWSYVKGIAEDYRTQSDGNAYTVGTADYIAQRVKMLDQLRGVDAKNIYFYDRFRPAQTQYFLSGAFGASLLDEIKPAREGKEITQADFTRILVRSLQAWGLYRSYEGNFRSGYTTNYLNKEVSFQESLQTVTKILFSKSNSDLEGMMEAAGSTMDRLSTGELIDIWNDMIGDWTTLSQSKRDSYLQQLWEVAMEGEPIGGRSVVSYLTNSERVELRKAWNVLLDVLLRFVEVDYNTNATDWNKSTTVVNGVRTPIMENITSNNEYYYGTSSDGSRINYSNVILGTLANNATALMQAHYPEINLAWLRSYDSFYDSDTAPVKINTNITPQVVSQISAENDAWESAVNGRRYEGDRLLKLSTDTAGAGIYYRIKNDDGNYGDWRPYNLPISLTARSESGTTYTVQTGAVYCGKLTAVTESSYIIQPISTYTVTVNGNKIGEFKANDVVTVDGTAKDSSQMFNEWEEPVVTDRAGNPITGEDAELIHFAKTLTVTQFLMPEGNVALTASYLDRIQEVKLTVAKPKAGKNFPGEGKLTWKAKDGTNQEQTVSVYWIELRDKTGDTPQTASGQAKPATDYAVAALIPKDKKTGLVFAEKDVLKAALYYVDAEGEEPAEGAEDDMNTYFLNSNGSLQLHGNRITTDKAQVTKVGESTVSIVKDSSKSDLQSVLPDTVALTTTDGIKTAKLSYSDEELGKVDLTNEGTYKIYADIAYSELNLDAEERFRTAEVMVKVYSKGQVEAPTAVPTSGSYTDASLKVALACATKDASIQYKVVSDKDGTYYDTSGYTEGITLTCKEGETKTFTVTAWATKDGFAPSEEVTFTYTLTNPLPTYTVTINGRDTGTKQGVGELLTKTYTYTKGEKVTIAALYEEDELFERWEGIEDFQGVVNGNPTDTALTVDAIDKDITLTAVYNPIVKQIDLTMDAPMLGTPLAKNLTKAIVTVTKENDATEYFSEITWTPALQSGATPAYNTAYTAKLTLKDDVPLKFFLSEALVLNVNGDSEGIVASLSKDEKDKDIIYVTFPATDKVGLLSVAQPDNSYVTREEAGNQNWKLKDTTATLTDGSQITVPIIWDVAAYQSSNLEVQTLPADGIVQIPDDVEQGSVSNKVNASVFVEAAEQVKMPVSSLSSGAYTGAQTLRLSCDTEGAEIYYTLDGKDATTGSTKYNGEVITLANATNKTELHAIAVKDGMRTSTMAIYHYDITADAPSPSGGGGGGGSKKPDKPETDTTDTTNKGEEATDYAECDRSESCPLHRFTDLDVNGWYHDGIHYCLDNKLMFGYDNGSFGPSDRTSRAQIVTILWRMAGSPTTADALRFTDVAEGMYYTEAIRWATSVGIVSGYGDGRFGVNDSITREQLTAMLYRFAKQQGQEISIDEDADVSGYADAAAISEWALPSMQWACGAGLIKGESNRLMPQGTATRAQVSAILQRLCTLTK